MDQISDKTGPVFPTKLTAKCVTSWFVESLPNGIYHLLVNTTERGENFHAYNDTMFIFGHEDGDSQEEWLEKQLVIPEFLPKIEKGIYIMTNMQNKDQISFYWIPFHFSWVKNGDKKIIMQSPKNEKKNS